MAEFTVNLTGTPFNLDYTLESGQVFRWEKRGAGWFGIIGGSALKVRQEGDSLYCAASEDALDTAAVVKYFRLDEDLQSALGSVMKDETITSAVQRFYGLRLIRQDRWECLLSFVLATNSNIPGIKRMISRLCEKVGEPFSFEGLGYFGFPTAQAVADSTVAELRGCGLGYRAAFVKRVAEAVSQGRMELSELDVLDYKDARELLLRELRGEKILLGVGPKVADCVLLFSCNMNEAFPIDVWISRALVSYYPSIIGRRSARRVARATTSLGGGLYEEVSSVMRSYFGKYAGYAQQYLYMNARASGAG